MTNGERARTHLVKALKELEDASASLSRISSPTKPEQACIFSTERAHQYTRRAIYDLS